MASPPTKARMLASRLRQSFAIALQLTSDVQQWARASRTRALGAAIVAISLLTITVFLWTLLATRITTSAKPLTLQDALAALDERRYDDARELAEILAEEELLPPTDFGGPPFVLGAVASHEAANLPPGSRQRSAYLVAARLLQEAARRGFPNGRDAQGLLLLGESLLEAGQDRDAIPVLEKALQSNPQEATRLHRLLTIVHLRSPEPDLGAANHHSAAELADRTLAPHERASALLRRSEVLLQSNDVDEVSSLLDQLPEEVQERPAAKMIRARLWMAQANALTGRVEGSIAPPSSEQLDVGSLYQASIELLREIQAASRHDSELARIAMLLIGRCYAEIPREYDAALGQFARVRKLYPRTSEGIAASLGEANLLRRLDRTDEAAKAYARTLEAVGDPRDYRNQWVPLSSLRAQVVTALEELIERGRHETALTLLESFSPAFDPLTTLSQRALVFRSWGEQQIELAGAEVPTEADRLIRRGRMLLRKAAGVYEELGQLRVTEREYPEELWRAAENYMSGHSFSNAIRVLRSYLDTEAVARRPQALVMLGEAYLARGDLDRALAALDECIELHERDASVYAARILAARAHNEAGRAAEAEQLLRANLTAQGLTPASREWRESLLELGKLMYTGRQYVAAIRTLHEYVERYDGEEPDSLLARYYVAQAYRHAAREPLQKLASAITENERLKYRSQAEALLSESYTHFSRVQRTLTLKGGEFPLSRLEEAMLRNCYLLRGHVLFSKRDFEEALEVFRNASSLYQHDPVVLDAYLQIASCHRRLGQLQEARGAVEQAKIVLSRLPEDADYTVATAFGKEQWLRVLNDMSRW